MAQVNFVFDAETAAFVRGALKIQDEMKALAAKSAGLNQQTKQSKNLFADWGRSAARDLAGMAMGFLSVGAAIGAGRKIFQAWEQDAKSAAEKTKEVYAAAMDLRFIGEHYKDPQAFQKLFAFSQAARMMPTQAAPALYALESLTGYLDKMNLPAGEPERRRGAMAVEMAKMARMTSTAPLELVPVFAKSGAAYPDLPAVQQANIANLMLQEGAVTTVQELSQYAPAAFSSGRTGRVDAPTAGGMFTFFTSITKNAADAATAMDQFTRKVMLAEPDEAEDLRGIRAGLSGKKTAAGGRMELIAAAGIASDDNAYQRLLKLGALHAQKPLSVDQLKDLFGERAMKYSTQMFESINRGQLKGFVEGTIAKTGPDKDIAGEKLGVVTANDPIFRMMGAGKAQDIAAEGAMAMDRDALILDNLSKSRERIRRERGLGTDLMSWFQEKWARAGSFGGAQTEYMATHALEQMLLEHGYVESSFEKDAAGRSPATAMARQWLGLDAGSAGQSAAALQQASEALMGAARKLEAATDKLPPVNQHVGPGDH